MKKYIYLIITCAFIISSLTVNAGLSHKFRVYFNQGVNNSVSSGTNAISVGANMIDTLINYINAAKLSIDIAEYEYSSYPNLAAAVDSAYTHGVVVRWIYDATGTNTGLTALNDGIHTLERPTNSSDYIMHDKFVIIDAAAADSNTTWVYTTSMDWNTTQVESDYNNTVVIQSQQLAKAYTAQFNQMWGGSGPAPVAANEKFGSAKTSLGPHIFHIDGIEVELYFSPTDSTNNHIIDMLHSANSQLFFGVYTFTEAPNADTINAKYDAGVYTYGIVDQYSEGYAAYTAMNPVLGTTHLKVYANSNYIYHNKYAVADACNTASDPQVLTGSHNWTVGANTGNDENTIIIHDPTIANIYYQAFSSDFTSLGGTITGCTVSTTCNNAISSTVQTNSNVLCYGGTTGEATVHASGTGTPFTYAWNPGGQTDSVLGNVAAGTYDVTITDHNACSVTASVTISQPAAALSVTATPVAVSCYGSSNGSVSGTVSGGTSGYAYVWNTSPQQTSATANSVPVGTYKITVTDANNCTASASATVSGPSQITATQTIIDVSCLGGHNGSIAVSASGGAGNYHYVWNTSPQQTTSTADSLTSGNYTVTITDANSCTATATYTVTQPASGITLSTTTGDATCGSNNGSATVSVTSGSGTYTYDWSTGAQTPSISGIAAGSYSVIVTGTGGCTATTTAIVNSTGGATISASSTPTTCGQANGSVSVTITSGNGSYTYVWSNSSTATSINNLASGVYTVTVTQSGCPAIASVTVGTSTAPSLSVSSTNASCGGSNGSASVSVSGGVSPYTYSWSNNSSADSIANVSSGNYTVTVHDNVGCSAMASITIGSSGGGGSVSISTGSAFICQGDTAQICSNAAFNNYLWSNGGTGNCIAVTQAGMYDLSVTASGNCTAVSGQLQIQFYSTTQVSISVSGNTLTCSQLATYQWFLNGQSISGATSNTYVAIQSGNYSVSGTDLNGCNAQSTTRFVTISGINNLPEDNILIYPNPSTSFWQLQMPAEWMGAQYELFDESGKLVAKSEITTTVTTISNQLAQGIYFIKINSGQQSVVRKVIKL